MAYIDLSKYFDKSTDEEAFVRVLFEMLVYEGVLNKIPDLIKLNKEMNSVELCFGDRILKFRFNDLFSMIDAKAFINQINEMEL